jgi:predicted SAM-dependent methyltransferase
VKLDIACGQSKQKGFKGVDIAKVKGVDTVHDLTKFPWPFKDNSVEEAYCSHYVEHTPDLVAFMNEVYRILKPDAQIRIVHPHLRSDRAFQDPTHTRFIPEATWSYFARDWREANALDHYPIKTDFGIEQMFYNGFQGDWGQRSEQARQFALVTYWNVAVDLVIDLKCRKARK